jgi:soluble lytic murein transglycosylase
LLRIERAAERGNAGMMHFLARRLDAGLRAQVEAEAKFIERPSAVASRWPSTPRSRAAVEAGLGRLARADPAAAEVLLDTLQTPLKLELERSGRLRNAIALWSAASYLPEAADRFARVPASAFDTRLHEWQVRERLAQRDGVGALAALAAMPDGQRDTARWRLIESRLRPQQGEAERARALLVQAAAEANFHGFLAADLLDRDYHLCALEPPSERAIRRRIAVNAGLMRALDLYEVGRPGWAAQEWAAALRDVPLPEQALAVEAALARGWNDRAAQTLGSGEGMRYYGQRFPLPHASALRTQSTRHRLHPEWVAGLIRAESSWMSGARSPADARGLMQLLPSTAQQTARRLGQRFSGAPSLHNPLVNIELGTAYLREMLDAHGGQPGLATAAYNAGPAAVARWRQARPQTAPLLDDTILWLETIPFHETRDYVARVMAFSLIYDWRLDGRAGSLLARLEGRADRSTRGFICTTTPAP